MTSTIIIETLDWVGTITYLVAYALISLEKTEGNSVLYQGLNIFADALLVACTLYLKAYAPTGLNAV